MSGATHLPRYMLTLPRCKVRRTSDLSVVNNTDTVIDWGTEDYDTDTTAPMHDAVTNPSRITVTVPGLYVVAACLEWQSGGGTGNRRLILRRNGVHCASDVRTGTATNATRHGAYCEIEMAAGDYFDVVCFQTSGGALLMLGGTTGTPWFSARMVQLLA